MTRIVDLAKFVPTAGGTGDWVVSSAVTGYQTPATAGAVSGAVYNTRAESGDLSQWEVATGTYTSSNTTLTRGTVLYNSVGGSSKINFTTPPQVGIVALSGNFGTWSNLRNAQTSSYAVANTDAGKTIALGGTAFYPLTFNAASGYDANFSAMVVNEDSSRGKTISCNGLSDFILWPGQSVLIYNDNNVWKKFPDKQLWMLSSQPTFNANPAGSDSNDGLGTGSSGAFKTLGGATANAYANVYTRDQGSIVIDGGSNSFQEFLQVFYPLNGGGTLIFQNLTWLPPNASFCLQFGDGSLVGLTSVTLGSSAITSAAGLVTGHNHGVLDVNAGVTVYNTGLGGNSLFGADYDSHFNINNGLTVIAVSTANGGGFLYNGEGPRTVWNIGGPHSYQGGVTMNRFAWVSNCSVMEFQGNYSSSGTFNVSVSLVNLNGVMLNLSGSSLPGGTPTPTTGGQYATTTTA